MKKYLFIDRDGTLIEEPHPTQQVDSLDKLMLEPDVIPVLLSFQHAGYHLVMVSNQDGLGTSAFPQSDFDQVQNKLLQIFSSQGIYFDNILICPHFADEQCDCRKPQLGLVRHYLANELMDSAHSHVIGDRLTDLQLAENMRISGLHYQRDKNGWKNLQQQLLSPSRKGHYQRQTKETTLCIDLNLDSSDEIMINTGIHFFDHMLTQIATHGGFSLIINAVGDIQIDDHHTIEDTGIALGYALKQALTDKHGLARFGFTLPMDECLAQCALDLSGRPYLVFCAPFNHQHIGDMSSEMVEHFFHSLAYSLDATLHLSATGKNDHHRAESLFKAFGRSLRQAIHITGTALPSSKGVL